MAETLDPATRAGKNETPADRTPPALCQALAELELDVGGGPGGGGGCLDDEDEPVEVTPLKRS